MLLLYTREASRLCPKRTQYAARDVQRRRFTPAALDLLSGIFSRKSKKQGKTEKKKTVKAPLSEWKLTDMAAKKKRDENHKIVNSIVTQKINFKRPPPHLWFPKAREMERKIIAHVGPTNSGKTYHAVNRLVSNEGMTGIYCGPLRLLAWETFESLNSQGCKTNLLTGQERDFPHEDARALCCTVEMAQTDYEFDIAIIDEIQMLGDYHRGGHWTNALLGIQAKEIHVCGELRTIGLLEKICRETNEELIINRYDRLSELDYESEEVLTDFSQLRAGDCLVGFRRRDLFRLKHQVEKNSKKKCCMVYGALPPSIRKSQASLFNQPNNDYDVLVATDAVGMGLNLSIGRVIFESMEKFDGSKRRALEQHEVKQIGGRAGRYKSNFPVGYVTTMKKKDRSYLTEMMAVEAEDMEFAYVNPQLESITEFAEIVGRVELNIPSNFLKSSAVLDMCNKYGSDNFTYYDFGKKTHITIRSFNEVVAIALMELCDKCFVDKALLKANSSNKASSPSMKSRKKNGIKIKFSPERTHRLNGDVVQQLEEETQCKIQLHNWDNMAMQQVVLDGDAAQIKQMLSRLTDLIVTPNNTFMQSDIDLSRCHLSSLLPYYSDYIEVDSDAYRFGDYSEQVDVSFHLNDIRMPLELRHLLTAAPVRINQPEAVAHFKRMILALLNEEEVYLDINVPHRPPNNQWQLAELEKIFSIIDVYLWLSLRFPEDFVDRELAIKKADIATRHVTHYLEKRGKMREEGKHNKQKKLPAKAFINKHSRDFKRKKGSFKRSKKRFK